MDIHASEVGSNDADLKTMRLRPVESIDAQSRTIQYSDEGSESEDIDVCHHREESKNKKQVLVMSSQQFFPKDYRMDKRPRNLSTLSEP